MNGGNAEKRDDVRKLDELAFLCSSVSHNLINAFSSIVSNAELIRTQSGSEPDSSDLEISGGAIVETALEASKVARKLIDWSRQAVGSAGDQSNVSGPPVNLNSLIRERVELEKAASGDRVDWILTLGSIPPISGSARALSSMLSYLLDNAREALVDHSGTVEVSTYIDPRKWLVVTVRDTGRGMNPEVLRRATEPFFSTKPDHAGVGLTIAQVIWRRHRGSLSIDSQPGLGTTIRLSLGPISGLS